MLVKQVFPTIYFTKKAIRKRFKFGFTVFEFFEDGNKTSNNF